MKVKVKAKIYPSEDSEKVVEAVNNLFPSIDFEILGDFVKGESDELESLEDFRNRLGLHAIRDSARRELKKGKKEDSVHFYLNKQSATVDRVNFSNGDTPLGPIEVVVETKNPDDFIDYLAPGKKERNK